MERLQQALDLAVGHFAPGAGLDTGDRQRTDADAAEALDGDADRVHHPAHQVIDTLVDDDFENQALGRFANDTNLFRHDSLAFDHDAVSDSLQGRFGRPAEREYLVLLVELVPGMHDAIRDITIIGQQQQALRVAIEPADRINAFRDLHEIHHRAAIALIFDGRDVSARFVEQNVTWPLRLKDSAIDTNDGSDWVGLRTKLSHDHAVDIDPPSTDQFLGITPRAHASGGQNTLKPFHRRV